MTINDFDFLVGSWTVVNRRLTKPLTGGDEWDEFPATCTARTFFDGAGSFDEIHFPTKGFSGSALRSFDHEAGEWFIYWVNSRTGHLQPPVSGVFTDGVGSMYGDDQHDGDPVRVRYQWSEITSNTARWEQAFSVDGERTWETNWIMEFTRVDN
ncbi:FIG00817011: hypothetical protein [Alloactinosynnema sp. L-07]|uniref:hypothetical protein n=1 Tax=Alloactinosynnema sp. L-07 TaxID=1653480 RepID=UPI00065F0827|nr:hypothetical protein [Alloactinosynnema sp. L-07]CRK62042.1 FIG00817011: hypothetical protein [Alloactinosynnema sp. L-07]